MSCILCELTLCGFRFDGAPLEGVVEQWQENEVFAESEWRKLLVALSNGRTRPILSFVGFNVPSHESPIPPLFISDQEQMWFRRDLKPDDYEC